MAPALGVHCTVAVGPATPVAPRAGEVVENAPSVRGPVDAAEATAAAASIIPLPHRAVVQVLPAGNGATVDCRMLSTVAGEADGRTDLRSAATPATCGVAIDVPWYPA